MTKRSGKRAEVTISLWLEEDAGDIHLSIPGHGLSTVTATRRASAATRICSTRPSTIRASRIRRLWSKDRLGIH
jgi:hypothetical protein